MKLTIWGARGSIPSPLTTADLHTRIRHILERSRGLNLDDPENIDRFIERLPPHLSRITSGNTSCVTVEANNTLFIIDMGSGIRMLSKQLLAGAFGKGAGEAHILMSHVHWDHIEGFPFFVPIYIKGNQFHFHTPYDDMEWRLSQVMRAPFFPVELDYPEASRHYHKIEIGQAYEVNGVHIEILPLQHPGTSYAYKLSYNGKVMIYANDGEYPQMDHENTAAFEAFFRNADALIFDAMYSYEDAVTSKADWGHATPRSGAELAWRAKVKKLILTHHDPEASDTQLWANVEDADQHLRHRNSRVHPEDQHHIEVLLAYEGLSLEL